MHVRAPSFVVAALTTVFSVLVASACSSFSGNDTEGSPPDTTDAAATEAAAIDGGAPNATSSVGCGADVCAGPAFCCFPPTGNVDHPARCLSMTSACTGDDVAVFCDDPSDCAPMEACCITVNEDTYRTGSATCRKTCGEGDAGAKHDIRLCRPGATGVENQCPKGDCVALGDANRAITGGLGIQVTGGLYGCNAN